MDADSGRPHRWLKELVPDTQQDTEIEFIALGSDTGPVPAATAI